MKELTNRAMSLLSQISALNKKHEEIARITGRKFNVFSILGVESRETSTHSAFLVELLNPDGSHGQGKVFLELFIEMLGKKIPVDNIPLTNSERIEVKKEKYLGTVKKKYTEGGRADIVIFGTNGSICIENKIYAKDQKNQLIRYHNEYVKDGKNGLILYLTLWGGKASDLSAQELKVGIDYFTISYKKDILEWLIKCQKEVIEVPTIRDVIGQYIYLIKKLIGQGMAKEEERAFIKLLTNKNNAGDFIAMNHAFISFLGKVKQKLEAIDKGLHLWEYRKSGKIYSGLDKQKDLQSVLFIEMKEVCGENGVQLKIRLSPHGWNIELWKTKGIQVMNAEKSDDKKYRILYKQFPFETKESIVLDAVLNVTKDMRPGDQ